MKHHEPLGLAIVSGVRHAASYIPMLLQHQDLQIRVIVEENSAPAWAHADAETLGAKFDIPVSRDLDGTLARDDIAIALICSEPTRHARLAETALRSDKHVIQDKPFATTLDQATSLLRAANSATGTYTMIQRTLAPEVVRARHAIDAGQIGYPIWLDIEWIASDGLSGEAVERPELVTDTELSGGGEIMNFLTYPASTLRYLTGLEALSVFVEAGSLFFTPHQNANVEDIAVISIEMERGVLASVTVGRVPQAPGHAPVNSSMRVIGTHGHLTVEENAPTLELWKRKEVQARRIGGDAGEQAIHAVLNNAIMAIREGRQPAFGAADGWATTAMIEAAYRSMRSGKPEIVLDAIATNP